MKPEEHAAKSEANPTLPPGEDERVSGYGVMGQPFASGHVLGLRRWTASSVGSDFTSIWHRYPDGRWRFLESAPSEIACSRWFGRGIQESLPAQISIDWPSPTTLHVTTADGSIDWTLELGSSPMTHVMNAASALMPLAAWRSATVLRVMSAMASLTLGVGKVGLAGLTANGLPYAANPLKIWRVTESAASVDGVDVGPASPLEVQTRLGDFWLPQHGIFAMGRLFLEPDPRSMDQGPGPQ